MSIECILGYEIKQGSLGMSQYSKGESELLD